MVCLFVFTINVRSSLSMAANIWILGLIEEVQCIYKAVKCNWEPIGKAEVVYI